MKKFFSDPSTYFIGGFIAYLFSRFLIAVGILVPDTGLHFYDIAVLLMVVGFAVRGFRYG